MAQRDADKVQLDFPQLTADVIAALRLTGTLGLFDFSDVVIPTISVGNVRPQTFVANPVTYESGEIFSAYTANPAINTVLVDTGALGAGVYDCIFGFSYEQINVTMNLEFQWRNAANAANLAAWPNAISNITQTGQSMPIGPFSLNIGLNERIRVITLLGATTGQISAYMMVALRPTP